MYATSSLTSVAQLPSPGDSKPPGKTSSSSRTKNGRVRSSSAGNHTLSSNSGLSPKRSTPRRTSSSGSKSPHSSSSSRRSSGTSLDPQTQAFLSQPQSPSVLLSPPTRDTKVKRSKSSSSSNSKSRILSLPGAIPDRDGFLVDPQMAYTPGSSRGTMASAQATTTTNVSNNKSFAEYQQKSRSAPSSKPRSRVRNRRQNRPWLQDNSTGGNSSNAGGSGNPYAQAPSGSTSSHGRPQYQVGRRSREAWRNLIGGSYPQQGPSTRSSSRQAPLPQGPAPVPLQKHLQKQQHSQPYDEAFGLCPSILEDVKEEEEEEEEDEEDEPAQIKSPRLSSKNKKKKITELSAISTEVSAELTVTDDDEDEDNRSNDNVTLASLGDVGTDEDDNTSAHNKSSSTLDTPQSMNRVALRRTSSASSGGDSSSLNSHDRAFQIVQRGRELAATLQANYLQSQQERKQRQELLQEQYDDDDSERSSSEEDNDSSNSSEEDNDPEGTTKNATTTKKKSKKSNKEPPPKSQQTIFMEGLKERLKEVAEERGDESGHVIEEEGLGRRFSHHKSAAEIAQSADREMRQRKSAVLQSLLRERLKRVYTGDHVIVEAQGQATEDVDNVMDRRRRRQQQEERDARAALLRMQLAIALQDRLLEQEAQEAQQQQQQRAKLRERQEQEEANAAQLVLDGDSSDEEQGDDDEEDDVSVLSMGEQSVATVQSLIVAATILNQQKSLDLSLSQHNHQNPPAPHGNHPSMLMDDDEDDDEWDEMTVETASASIFGGQVPHQMTGPLFANQNNKEGSKATPIDLVSTQQQQQQQDPVQAAAFKNTRAQQQQQMEQFMQQQQQQQQQQNGSYDDDDASEWDEQTYYSRMSHQQPPPPNGVPQAIPPFRGPEQSQPGVGNEGDDQSEWDEVSYHSKMTQQLSAAGVPAPQRQPTDEGDDESDDDDHTEWDEYTYHSKMTQQLSTPDGKGRQPGMLARFLQNGPDSGGGVVSNHSTPRTQNTASVSPKPPAQNRTSGQDFTVQALFNPIQFSPARQPNGKQVNPLSLSATTAPTSNMAADLAGSATSGTENGNAAVARSQAGEEKPHWTASATESVAEALLKLPGTLLNLPSPPDPRRQERNEALFNSTNAVSGGVPPGLDQDYEDETYYDDDDYAEEYGDDDDYWDDHTIATVADAFVSLPRNIQLEFLMSSRNANEAPKQHDDDESSKPFEEDPMLREKMLLPHNHKLVSSATTSSTASDSWHHDAKSAAGSEGIQSHASSKSLEDLLHKDLIRPDTLFVEAAMRDLSLKTSQDAEYRTSVVKAGGILALVRSMEHNVANPDIQIHACQVLEHLARHDSQNKWAIAELGGVEAVMGALANYMELVRLSESACACLLVLLNPTEPPKDGNNEGAKENQDQQQPTGSILSVLNIEAAVVGVFVACMKLHSKNYTIQQCTFAILTLLCLDDKYKLIALSAQFDGLAVMSTSLGTHWKNSALKQGAIASLAALFGKLAELQATGELG